MRVEAGFAGRSSGVGKSAGAMKTYPASYLCDVVYGVESMTQELAEIVRELRVGQRLSYAEVGYALCEQGADGAVSFQVGQCLSRMAEAFLRESGKKGWL